MLEKGIAWVEKFATHKHAHKALALVSFVESSFFPIPPFVLVVAMLAHEKKPSWKKIALIGTLSSVLGGLFGYVIGMFFYSYIGKPLIDFYGLTNDVAYLGTLFKAHVFATIILASLSPIPYKVFTLSAGLFSVNIVSFVLASLIGRSIRFFTVSYLADRYGIRMKERLLQQQKIVGNILLLLVIVFILYLLAHARGIL